MRILNTRFGRCPNNWFMTAYWKTLQHNGVYFPPVYSPGGLSVDVKGRAVQLTPLAEEMAYNLAKKKDTQYIQDPVFRSNFMSDFLKRLPQWCAGAKFEEVDFSLLYRKVDSEKKAKEAMGKEEKKAQAGARKEARETLKAHYGFAILDGKRVEFGNYMVEPPGLFMGRGQHPMRGRWKPRVLQEDVVLNLGKEAPVPPGKWKDVVHDHDSMWMAKWIDKLTDKEKYVWLHESSELQQSRNRAKYDNAKKVGSNLEKIRRVVETRLSDKDPRSRQVAAVCYLIDRLGMRVGDEKDEDEADTVGASTLRVEHLNIGPRTIGFNFLGKDSIPWNKKVEDPPQALIDDLVEFTAGKKPGTEVFHEVSSSMVNQFLSSIVRGVTAKVFRTYHATKVADDSLNSRDVSRSDDTDKLYHAKYANLAAAKFCNHQRTPPKNWDQSLEKKRQRLSELEKAQKRDEKRIKKLRGEIDFQVRTRTYNLNTSLKNYIDPRVYKEWCDRVGFDWAKLYTKSMQRKFSWVTSAGADPDE